MAPALKELDTVPKAIKEVESFGHVIQENEAVGVEVFEGFFEG